MVVVPRTTVRKTKMMMMNPMHLEATQAVVSIKVSIRKQERVMAINVLMCLWLPATIASAFWRIIVIPMTTLSTEMSTTTASAMEKKPKR